MWRCEVGPLASCIPHCRHSPASEYEPSVAAPTTSDAPPPLSGKLLLEKLLTAAPEGVKSGVVSGVKVGVK